MKKRYVVFLAAVIVCLLAGCGSEFGGGVAAGAAGVGAITGAASVYQQQEAELQARYQAALDSLEKATTEAEKLAAQAEAETAKKQLLANQTIQAALNTSKEVLAGWSSKDAVTMALVSGVAGWATRWLKINSGGTA